MDEVFHDISHHFEQRLPNLPYHRSVVDLLKSGFVDDLPNILLYGQMGFPQSMLWDIAVKEHFGNFRKTTCTWNKKWIYEESPYYFEIDLKHPQQPKEMGSLSEFLREIMVHQCMHISRHIFVLKHIDVVCAKDYSGMFRVLLEKYSKNAWFVCTTHHMGGIEPPLQSRFLRLRVPLLTSLEIKGIMESMGRTLPEEAVAHNIRSLPFAVFLSDCVKYREKLPYTLDVLCSYHAPFLSELSPKVTLEDIRATTHKLCVHGYSMSDITMDMMQRAKSKGDHIRSIIAFAAHVDHMCSCTDKYRKMLYIEWFLHNVLYGVGKIKDDL